MSSTASKLVWLLSSGILVACGSNTGSDPDATDVPVGNDGTTIAATEAGIVAFLETDEHETWVKEPAVHRSAGPHDHVRSYFNDAYAAARRSSMLPMPVGATSVKEIYREGEETPYGYAVSIKTRDGDGADTWTWLESLGLPDVAYFGVANPTCEGCHSGAGSQDRSLTETIP